MMSAGSSPHTRGTHSGEHDAVILCRFIPAYAGNACTTRARAIIATVHPRIRGERRVLPSRSSSGGGSSPHTRGTRRPCSQSAAGQRFIPAYAGNAAASPAAPRRSTVHPRIRGERSWPPHRSSNSTGSSPHTRGTHSCRLILPQRSRFIPAYAGNALLSVDSTTAKPVHPRIRGERAIAKSRCVSAIGSSPHTRGTHFQ